MVGTAYTPTHLRSGGASQLRFQDKARKLWCHKLDEQDFNAVKDKKHYTVF